MKRWIAAAGLAFVTTTALACPICFREMALTPAQQLAVVDRAVIVEAIAGDASPRVVEVVKGDSRADERITTAAVVPPGTVLLVRPSPSASWLVVGPVSRKHAALLRALAITAPTATSTDTQWSDHVTALLPYLTDSEPLIAQLALGELARAPYAALRTLKPQLNAAALQAGVDDPTRQAVYTLLMGIAGGHGTADLIDQRITAAWRNKDASNLAALVAADLELRGPARLPSIQAMYFTDRDRTLAEIDAVLLALSVQGDVDAVIPRSRVIRAFVDFMRQRKPMAASVAAHLAEWEYWDAVPAFVDLLKTGTISDPASRLVALNYLASSPRADAKAAVRTLTIVRQ